MFQKFVTWLKSLFSKPEAEVETFGGWIKDEVDPRDKIFGETK